MEFGFLMDERRDRIINKLLVFLFLCLLESFSTASAVEIIVNNKNTVSSSYLTTYQVRQIYTMRQTVWPNGQSIVVYALPSDSILHKRFSKEVLKIFPYQLDRIWRKLTYSGLGNMPIIVSDLSELKRAVAGTPGAVGYLESINEEEVFNVIEIKE